MSDTQIKVTDRTCLPAYGAASTESSRHVRQYAYVAATSFITPSEFLAIRFHLMALLHGI